MRRSKVSATLKVSFDNNYRTMKRPKFADVVREIWVQLDDLGHDLRNALLVAPRGASPRQVSMALNQIEQEKREIGRERLRKKSGGR